jgi:hypothetical protein
MPYLRAPAQTSAMLAATLLLAACESKSSNSASTTSTATGSGTSTGTGSGAGTATGTTSAHYQDFCKQIAGVKPRADVSAELALLCSGDKAAKRFEELYQEALTQTSGDIKIYRITTAEDDAGYSNIQVAWSFLAPKKIADFRNAPLIDKLSEPYTSATIEQTTKAEKNGDDTLDSPLHLISVNFTYDMNIKNEQNLDLSNKRNTQFNLYQVQGGNENLGVAIEHLVDTDNEDYKRATMFNAAVSAPDGKGAVIVTVLNYSIFNKGLHSTAVDSIEEVAKNAGASMYKALQ